MIKAGIVTIWRKMWAKNSKVFDLKVEDQLSYINSLGTPRDLYERSINQYKCQMKQSRKITSVALNIISIIVLPLHTLLLVIISFPKRSSRIVKLDAVYFKDLPLSYVQNSLKKEYSVIRQISPNKGSYCGKAELKFLFGLTRKCKYPYLIYKSFVKISQYGWVIKNHQPKCIIVSNEFSFTSSVLTAYCRYRGVQHFNVMHGEKLLNMRDSFFQFDRCYVWHKHYQALFSKLGAAKEQFVVELPDSMRLFIDADKIKKFKYTYYLAAEKEDALRMIDDCLKRLSVKKKEIAIRPHPRYSDLNLVNSIFRDYTIENPETIDILESVNNTEYAVSCYSTVLLQVALNGGKIVIDDVSNKEQFGMLKEADYIGLNINHLLLSELLCKE